MRGDRRRSAKARECLASVGLPGRETRVVGALSHRDCKLLELAIALATQPKLLLLDEPLAGLGRAESDAMIAMLASLKGYYAMLLVQHDMEAVFALADRISVLVFGRIVASGDAASIRADGQVRVAYLGEDETRC